MAAAPYGYTSDDSAVPRIALLGTHGYYLQPISAAYRFILKEESTIGQLVDVVGVTIRSGHFAVVVVLLWQVKHRCRHG